MKENLILFLSNYVCYLDVVIGLDKDEKYKSIIDKKRQLNTDRINSKISYEEYIEKEADLFLEYLILLGVYDERRLKNE